MQTVIAAIITGGAAVIGAVLALVGVIITVKKSNRELLAEIRRQSELDDQRLDAKLEKFQAVTDTKIDELTREVREHNNFARRMPVVENDIKTIYKKLDRIEDQASEGK